MNQSKQEWRAAMSEAVATVVSTATAAIRVAEANVRRARRAADLVAAGAVQETTMPGVYVVAATREYTADLNTGACTCPDQVNRGGLCKHLLAAYAVQQVLYRRETANTVQAERLAA